MEKVFVAHHLDDDYKITKVLCYEPDCSEMHFTVEGESANVRVFDSSNVRKKYDPDLSTPNRADNYAALAAMAMVIGMVLLVLGVAATIAIKIVR